MNTYPAIPHDTNPEAHRVQVEAIRRMSIVKKWQIVYEMSRQGEALTRAGIKDRHPEYTDEQVKWAHFRMKLGDDLFSKVYPDAPRLKP